jgi:transcriptional regulator with XRE-family HTH domain
MEEINAMAQSRDHFQEFISDAGRRRIYECEALASEAAELIARLMEEQHVNKSELAVRAGTSKSHITNLLSGSRNMTMHTLADLLFALGHKAEISAKPVGGQPGRQKLDVREGWALHLPPSGESEAQEVRVPVEIARQSTSSPLPRPSRRRK